MLEYCAQDVVVTTALYEELLQWTTSPEAVKLEMDVARIIQRQHEYGVCFDREAAERLSARLVDEVGAILAELQRTIVRRMSWLPQLSMRSYSNGQPVLKQ